MMLKNTITSITGCSNQSNPNERKQLSRNISVTVNILETVRRINVPAVVVGSTVVVVSTMVVVTGCVVCSVVVAISVVVSATVVVKTIFSNVKCQILLRITAYSVLNNISVKHNVLQIWRYFSSEVTLDITSAKIYRDVLQL